MAKKAIFEWLLWRLLQGHASALVVQSEERTIWII